MNTKQIDYTKHSEVGKAGESIAKEYLKKKGYKIIDENHRTKYYEIDIIAWAPKSGLFDFDRELVFVEVRSKTNENHGRPEETIDFRKMQKLVKSTEAYIGIHRFDGRARIDAICVVFNDFGELERLSHYDNITG